MILCHLFGNKMAARGKGGIAVISSMGGLQGAVNFSTYNAGKAFEWILTESLWTELGDKGVDATCVLVGATSSPNYNAFQETLDPELCNRTDTDDPLDRARSRLMRPSTPGGGRHRRPRRPRLRPGDLHPPRRRVRGRPLLLAAPERGHPGVAPAAGDFVARP